MVEYPVLVFDLDGTLYPLDARLNEAEDKVSVAFLRKALNLPENEAKAVLEKARATYRYDAEAFSNMPFSQYDYMEAVCNIAVDFVKSNPRLAKLLAKFPQRKFILTDSTLSHVRAVFKRLGLDEKLFEAVFDGHDMNYEFKYTSKGFEYFLSRFKLRAADCLLFEDSLSNLTVAKNMGFGTVQITNKVVQPCVSADYVFDNIETALCELLKNL